MENEYAIAYSEVLEILKHIPIEYYNKIPKEKLRLFEANADKEHGFKYDIDKTLEEQNVSNIAKGIIIILFRDYWATETQKNKIITKQKQDMIKLEEKKKEKYNPNNIFKTNDENSTNDMDTIDTVENLEEKSLVEIKEDKWYEKIWRLISNLFRGNRK